MKILYVADTSSWHNALWTQYFSEKHSCIIFSDYKADYKPVNFEPAITRAEYPPVIDLGNRHLNKITSTPAYLRRLKVLCREFQPDIIHAVALYYGVLGTFAANYSNAPLIYTLQGSEVLLRASDHWLYRNALQFIARRASLVTGDSNSILNAAAALGLPPEKRRLVQNGVRLEQFKPIQDQQQSDAIKDRLGIPRTGARIICSPRGLIPLYNIALLIESAVDLLQQDDGLYLLFTYGFGDENLGELQQLADQHGIGERCKWLGYVDHKEMADIYRASDVVVSIPMSDSSPKSVYEAAACGTPVVVSKLDWVDEYFGPANALYPTAANKSDVQKAISLALAELAAGDDGNVERAKSVVQTHFSYHDNMAKMETMMSNLVSTQS